MVSRILITGRNNTVPAHAFTGLPTRQVFTHSGMKPGSVPGGTRAPSSLPTTPSGSHTAPPLGVKLAEVGLYVVLFFGAGFGLAWSF